MWRHQENTTNSLNQHCNAHRTYRSSLQNIPLTISQRKVPKQKNQRSPRAFASQASSKEMRMRLTSTYHNLLAWAARQSSLASQANLPKAKTKCRLGMKEIKNKQRKIWTLDKLMMHLAKLEMILMTLRPK